MGEWHRKKGTVLLLSASFSSPQLFFPVYAYYACNIHVIDHLANMVTFTHCIKYINLSDVLIVPTFCRLPSIIC